MNRTPVVLNSDLIEHMESTPDTVISMTTGQKVVVLESADEVIRRVLAFRRAACGCAHVGPGATLRRTQREDDE